MPKKGDRKDTPAKPGQREQENPGGTRQKATGQNPGKNRTDQETDDAQGRAGQAGNRTTGRGGQDSQVGGQVNSYFIACLRADNKNEIQASKLATQRASSPDVKEFAQQMIKEHSEFLAKLDRLAPSGGSDDATSTTRETRGENPASKTDARRSDTDDNSDKSSDERGANDKNQKPSGQRNTTAQPGGQSDTRSLHANAAGQGSGAVGQLIQIKQEIAERCLASLQEELSEKQGAEFDKCFMGMQVGAHMHMVDALTVISRHATGDLKKLTEEGRETAQQHLDHAKQIAKAVDGSDSGERRSAKAPADKDTKNK